MLAHVLESEWAVSTMLLVDGLRRQASLLLLRQSVAVAFGAPQPADGRATPELERLREYTRPLSADQPTVRFAAAATEMAVRQGTRVLVVVTPVPVTVLDRDGLYDAAEFATRIDVLRDAVTASGGRLVDLHAAVAADAFYDDGGHMTERGEAVMSAALAEPIARALDLPTPPAPARP